jgi:hypothetical protein
VSRLPDAELGWFQIQPDLGNVAAQMGAGMKFSNDAASKAGVCGLGRYGFAMFRGGQFPAMFLWVTVASKGVWLWTWLGPDPTSPEARAAVAIVMTALETA